MYLSASLLMLDNDDTLTMMQPQTKRLIEMMNSPDRSNANLAVAAISGGTLSDDVISELYNYVAQKGLWSDDSIVDEFIDELEEWNAKRNAAQ